MLSSITDRIPLARCETKLEKGIPLTEGDKQAVLAARLNLIANRVDMAQIASTYPRLDAVMGCDAEGNPVWKL